jgi:hypothetical protein
MQGRKVILASMLLVPFVALAVMTGCKRQYPSRPLFVPSYTPTPLLSNTFTVTPTITKTFTRTTTITFTRTPTGMVTSTFTLTLTPTYSPTVTATRTPTQTATWTSTSLPPVGIDDLEDGNTTINGIFGITNPGPWYAAGDASCSPVMEVMSPGANSSTYAIQLTGSGCATFGALGFWLFDDTTLYGSYYNVRDASTGVRFDIRQSGGNVTSVRFEYLDDFSANGIPGNSCGTNCQPGYGKDLVVSSSWAAVTVFWVNCTLPTWYTGTVKPADPWNMYGMHWIANANGQDFGIQLDNVMLVNDPPPPTPTPDCSTVENMEDNDNRGVVYQSGDCGSDGSIGLHSGFWYTYQDTFGGEIAPSTTEKFFMSSPGASSSYAARLTGTNSTAGGDIYAGMGLNLLDPKNFYDATVNGKYSGVRFDAKVGASSAVSIRFKIPDVNSDPAGITCQATKCYDDYGMDMELTTSWVTYSLPFSTLTQVGFGYDPGGFTPTQVSALQWQFLTPGVDFELWVDNVILY